MPWITAVKPRGARLPCQVGSTADARERLTLRQARVGLGQDLSFDHLNLTRPEGRRS
jgi:hypothetical protein